MIEGIKTKLVCNELARVPTGYGARRQAMPLTNHALPIIGQEKFLSLTSNG